MLYHYLSTLAANSADETVEIFVESAPWNIRPRKAYANRVIFELAI
jgi:hypothetical protein